MRFYCFNIFSVGLPHGTQCGDCHFVLLFIGQGWRPVRIPGMINQWPCDHSSVCWDSVSSSYSLSSSSLWSTTPFNLLKCSFSTLRKFHMNRLQRKHGFLLKFDILVEWIVIRACFIGELFFFDHFGWWSPSNPLAICR